MTATNHVLTGAVIAANIANPLIALPAALLSHLALDGLPHYGDPNHTGRKFLYVLTADAGAAAAILLSIFLLRPANAWLLIAAGVIAASPDLLWLPPWLRELKNLPARPKGRLTKFLGDIQWGERPWGLAIEIPFGLALVYALIASVY